MPLYESFNPSGFAVPHTRVLAMIHMTSVNGFNILIATCYNNYAQTREKQMWQTLIANVYLICVAIIFILEIQLSEEIVVFLLTSLCIVLL
jgi:hypothetical protein